MQKNKPYPKITQDDCAFSWRVNTRTIQRWEKAGVNPANALCVDQLYSLRMNMSPGLKQRLSEFDHALDLAVARWKSECSPKDFENPIYKTKPYLAYGFWLRLVLDDEGKLTFVVIVRDLFRFGRDLNPENLTSGSSVPPNPDLVG